MQRRGASAAVSLAAYSGPTVVLVTSRTSRAGIALRKFVGALHGAGADEDRITASAQFYFNALHLSPCRGRMSAAGVASICGHQGVFCAALKAAKIESATM